MGGRSGSLFAGCSRRKRLCTPSTMDVVLAYKTSSALFAEAKRFIPGGVNSPVRAFRNVGGEPFFVAKAKGSRLWDVEGKEYIDYVGTWGPAILGHAPDVVVEAVREASKGG